MTPRRSATATARRKSAGPGGRATAPAPAGGGRTLRRQGEATRTKLLEAALPALAEKGWHAARVDDVVRQAGVSHGTFYLYFSNKEDLFRALAERCADEADALAGSLPAVPDGEAGLAVLRAWLAEYLAFYRRNGVVIRAWTENQVSDRSLARLGAKSFERIATTVRSAMAGQPDKTPRQIELQATALLALIERFSYMVTSRDLGWTDDQVLDTLAVLVHRGFFRTT